MVGNRCCENVKRVIANRGLVAQRPLQRVRPSFRHRAMSSGTSWAGTHNVCGGSATERILICAGVPLETREMLDRCGSANVKIESSRAVYGHRTSR